MAFQDYRYKMTQQFLDEIISFNAKNVITYEGRDQCQDSETQNSESKNSESSNAKDKSTRNDRGQETDHHEAVGH